MQNDEAQTLQDLLPSTHELRGELERETHKGNVRGSVRSTVFMLVVVAAAAVLTAVLLLPILRIYGNSMQTTLDTGDVVLSIKSSHLNKGDIVAFYYNNNVLVKRVIAQEGDVVDIDQDGNVSVNGEQLEEDYLSSKALGETNVDLPYEVPEGKVFVMGDNRAVSIDSRNTAIGCVSSEQIVGKIVFRIWPFSRFGQVR